MFVSSHIRTTLLSGCICVQSVLATALYLPALTTITQEFALSDAMGQYSITAFILAQTIVPLLLSHVADRWGLKRMISLSIGIFSLVSWMGGVIFSGHMLLLCRFLQGGMIQTAVSLGYATLRATMSPQATIKALSYIALAQSGAYALAPIVGGLISSHWHWSINFYCMGFLSMLLLSVIRFYPVETPEAVVPFTFASMKKVITDRSFLFFSHTVATSHLCTIAFFTLAPFYFFSIGCSPVMVGFYIGLTSLGYTCGSFLLRWLSHRTKDIFLLFIGWGACISAGMLTIAAYCSSYTIEGIVAMQCLFAFGKAFLIPVGQTKALYHFQKDRAKAASLYNFIVTGMPIGGSLLGTLVSSKGIPLFLGGLMAGVSVINLSFFCLRMRRRLSH
ncbi:MFS transporter [bacterium NHP-B]|nr:MFS transporter [bacterium NHP-B]